MKWSATIAVVFLLAACAKPPRYWVNPELSSLPRPERSIHFRKANGYCQMMAETGGRPAQILPSAGNDFAAGWNQAQAFSTVGSYDRVYCACMESLGWFQE